MRDDRRQKVHCHSAQKRKHGEHRTPPAVYYALIVRFVPFLAKHPAHLADAASRAPRQ